mmetsp:Transcript_31755/g.93187  ORF Transcript_31755/g.93187 Transcript_31755/m.93187 type:complete len:1352 (-) Transcript_31755:118-4173(-)
MSKQIASTDDTDSNDECCVCGNWFPDEGGTGWVLCDSNCPNIVCPDCTAGLNLRVSFVSSEPFYCPGCRAAKKEDTMILVAAAEEVHAPSQGKRNGKTGTAGDSKKRNRKGGKRQSAVGKSALELTAEKAVATESSHSRPKRQSNGSKSQKPSVTNVRRQRSATATTSTSRRPSSTKETTNEDKASMVGNRVLEAVEASAALHRCIVSPHRMDRDEENKDGVYVEAAELAARDAAAASIAQGTSSYSDSTAQTAAAAAATASTDRKRTSSANSRGGKRGPKRQAFARRDQRRRDRLIREGERKRREEEERIAQEAALRQGLSGNLVSSAREIEKGSSAKIPPSSKPAPRSNGNGDDEPRSDKLSVDFAAASSKGGELEQEDYFEIDAYLDRRNGRQGVEYLVKWKGCPESEATWEPHENLCDSAYEDAKKWWKKEQKRRQRIAENERNLGLLPSRGDNQAIQASLKDFSDTQETSEDVHVTVPELKTQRTPAPVSAPPNTLEDPNWTWDDASQVKFRAVKRVSVHDDDAREQVTEARMNGTPIVLTGHVGWAGFAARWLRKSTGVDANPRADGVLPMLDLSDPDLYLDVKAMADDIGNEEVPVVKRDYNEEAPISGSIAASRFLETSWPRSTPEDATAAAAVGAAPTLYLHQWQFPLSESAALKLCNQSEPLPNDILGEDLLKYWLCRVSDCPLQYIFMGREETLSKLHKDPGGLAISIAPIVGEKECILVHRDDGQQCLYHLTAPLEPNAIDLDAFPLLSQARIWKTTVSPGEILLMPQGTYHQCRNVTPCLSYSRFHLDAVNLRAFINSYFDGDAPEMAQDEVLWNCAHALMEVVDATTDEARKDLETKRGKVDNDDDDNEVNVSVLEKGNLDPSLMRAVDTLRCLRHVAREFTRKLELRATVKGKASARTPPPENSTSKEDNAPKKWRQLVDDCDVCLHEFRYRYSEHVPAYDPRRSTGRKKLAMPTVAMRGSAALMAKRRSPNPGSVGAGRKMSQRKQKAGAALEADRQGRSIGDKLYNPGIPGAMQCPKVTYRGSRCRNVAAANSQFCLLHSARGDRSSSTNAPTRAKRAVNKIGGNGAKDNIAADAPIVAFKSEMETAWTCLPQATPLSKAEKQRLAVQMDKLTPGSRIAVDMMGRKCTADVLEIREGMCAVYMSYEDYPKLYNEYLPFDRLRMPSTGGGILTDMNPENIRPGSLAIALVGEKRDEYRGIIQHTRCETMYRCKVSFGGNAKTERWIVADSILSVGASGRKIGTGGNMVRKTSFLSTEAQWGQRAARQQAAEKTAEALDLHVADDDEDEAASSSSDNSEKKTRKRKAASLLRTDSRSIGGRSRSSMSNRSSASQFS